MRLEPRAHRALVSLRLDEMSAEDLCKLRIASRIRRPAQLLERLLLDRVGIGQVLDQLVVQGVGGHSGTSRADCTAQLVPPRTKLNLRSGSVHRPLGLV